MASSQAQEGCSDESYKRAKRVQRAQWLRAAILGANDGLLSTTSLMLGVGAVKEDRWSMVLSGLAGALAGACSMAVGEFVSVSTQRDIEKSIGSQSSSKALDLEGAHEIKNLDSVYVHASPLSSIRSPVMKVMTEEAMERNTRQGKWVKTLDPPELSGSSLQKKEEAKDQSKWVKALDPLEVSGSSLGAGKQLSDKKEEGKEENEDEALPSPYKAAAASAFAFLCGSLVPLAVAVLVAENMLRVVLIVVVASVALALSGAIGAYLGGSSVKVSAPKVLVGGWMAMGVTYGLLKPLDTDDNNKGGDKD